MGRYTGPVCRFCRRAGEKLFLKGERCYTPRCPIERRRPVPGGRFSYRRRMSDRGIQLREKQKARQIYGILERQMRRYISEAFNQPGVTGQHLVQLLERRLDNVVYRLGIADSRNQARQLVLHGHVQVNGRKMDIPSYSVKANDTVGWKASTKEEEFFKELTQDVPKRTVPAWLSLDQQSMEGKVLHLPEEEELESLFDTRMIVEYYSR